MSELPPAYPGTPYELLPRGAAAPALPPGHGGLALRVWVRPEDADATLPPVVGIDGEPATRGYGEALVALKAGPHIVEVQDGEPVRSALVDIAPGEVTAFAYTPADALGRPSRAGRRRPAGTGALLAPVGAGIVAALLVFSAALAVLLGANAASWPAIAAVTVLAVAGGAAVPLAVRARRRRPGPAR